MTDKKQQRMQGVPQIHLVSQDGNHAPEPKPKVIVKMIRVRDVVIGGILWTFISWIMSAVSGDPISWTQVWSPLAFAFGFIFLTDPHDVEV